MTRKPDLVCFSSISVSEPKIVNKAAKADITLNSLDGGKNSFSLTLKYDNKLDVCHLPVLRLAFSIPLLNYGLFSKKIILDFDLCESDLSLLNDLNVVFSRDIYVNKIIRRRTNFILPEYFPDEDKIKSEDAEPKAKFQPKKIVKDEMISDDFDSNSCGILSSGGKESLLTYGILNELGAEVYPLYVNESGGHWRTALTGYKYHKKNDKKTQRVWTNIDQFYNFMLDNLKFIRSDHRKVKADTYPIRLCIFPFYVFSLLPVFIDKKIGNLLIGSEFDDLRNIPTEHGIYHYYGVYDQHQDYDVRMNEWYSKRLNGLYQWSAMRNISGLIVEKILVKRYPHLAKLQRSCHSCHFEKNGIVPCGTCSKCNGILLFLLANGFDPTIMNFRKKDINSFPQGVKSSSLRLDQDEKDQSFYLLDKKNKNLEVKPVDHVERIHVNSVTCDPMLYPKQFRADLLKLIEGYTTGYCELKNEKWVPINKIVI